MAHVTRGNVLDDLGFAPKEALELKIKSDLHIAILRFIRRMRYSQADLAALLKVPQPRVSELMTGKLNTLSLRKLAEYAERLGVQVDVKVSVRKAA